MTVDRVWFRDKQGAILLVRAGLAALGDGFGVTVAILSIICSMKSINFSTKFTIT